MKSKLSLLLLFVSFVSFSQNQTEERDLQYQTEYQSDLVLNNSTIAVCKYNSPILKEISLVLSTETKRCTPQEGLTLTLQTGEILSLKNSTITCDKISSGKNKLTSTLLLTPELYEKLSNIEITTFQIGSVKVAVDYKIKGENLNNLFTVLLDY